MKPQEEKTLVLVKPDGVKRGLVGDVLHRIEQRGLKIIALKMITPTKEEVRKHYPNTEKWLRGMGEKTLEHYKSHGQEPVKELGTNDTLEIGKMVSGWLEEFLTSGPVVACVVQGIHAIEMVRKIVGNTIPAKADMGTVRGDYSVDSPTLANLQKRSIHNVVHASGDPDEAIHEIDLWFNSNEIHPYKRAEEDIMF
jgi:nucleoside-diphosphate kinase